MHGFFLFLMMSVISIPAYAQGAESAGFATQLIPLLLIFVIFWFLLIRPQQKKIKAHQEMVKNLRKGDEVITGGGFYGKVTKLIDEKDVEVEVADGTKVRVLRQSLMDVISKPVPASSAANDPKPGKNDTKKNKASNG